MDFNRAFVILITLLFTHKGTWATAIPWHLKDVSLKELQNTMTSPKKSLEDLVANALLNNPNLDAAKISLEKGILHYKASQLIENPELSIESENFLGTNDYSTFSAAETSLSLAQPIPLSGKRKMRGDILIKDKDILKSKHLKVKLDLIYDISNLYLNYLYQSKRDLLNKDILQSLKQLKESTKRRVSAGQISEIALIKVKSNIQSQSLVTNNIKSQRKKVIGELQLLYSSKLNSFDLEMSSLSSVFELPSIDKLESKLLQNIELQILEHKKEQKEHRIKLENANRYPDILAILGTKHFSDNNDIAFSAGISIPLPLFNNNSINIRLAKLEGQRITSTIAQVELYLKRQLRLAYSDADELKSQINILSNQLIPKLNMAYNKTIEGFTLGRFGYLEVIDIQKLLFETKERLLNSRLNYRFILLNIEKLLGGISLDTFKHNNI